MGFSNVSASLQAEGVRIPLPPESPSTPLFQLNVYLQVYSIRGWAIGRYVQALIIGKSLNPSKLAYLDY